MQHLQISQVWLVTICSVRLLIFFLFAVIKQLYIVRRWDRMYLYSFENGKQSSHIATIRIGTRGQYTVRDAKNLFFNGPRYNNGLAVLGINIQKIFPCLGSQPTLMPTCFRTTGEEDGFHGRRSFLQIGDKDNMNMFHQRGYVYALAIKGCSRLTRSCFPCYMETTITCLLPRSTCGWKPEWPSVIIIIQTVKVDRNNMID